MDEWFELIVTALKTKDDCPDERCNALIRAGLIAQAHAGSKQEVMIKVFGSGRASPLVREHRAHASKTAKRGAAEVWIRPQRPS